MKKKILITYLNNLDFKSSIAQRVMFSRLTDELIASGKELETEANFSHGAISTFTDGTQVFSKPIKDVLKNLHGTRFTHIYIDEAIINNIEGTTLNMITDTTIMQTPFGNYDTSGERINYYNMKDNQLKLIKK